jgi:dTDP-4-amino-4,6-dideoxygalactose transaminase
MPAICDLACSHGIAVIEDCAQAHGARIHGQSVGSFGDVAAWSFCQDKILSTAGEGGMVTTSRDDLWDAMWAFKDHGKTHEAVFGREHPPGFRWLHERFGSNFRLTELQSAIGRIQLQRLPDWTSARTRNALLPLQKEANALIARHCAAQSAWLEYLDLATPLMAADGSLRPELYQKDGLHLSPAGYAIWNALLRPHLLAK